MIGRLERLMPVLGEPKLVTWSAASADTQLTRP
jgi:hypothetical protein